MMSLRIASVVPRAPLFASLASLASLTSLVLLDGCSGGSPPPPSPPASTAEPTVTMGAASAAPTASAIATAASSQAPARAESPFHVVAIAENKDRVALQLLTPKNGLFVTSGDMVMPLRDGAVVRDDAVTKGVEMSSMTPIVRIEGRWPDAAYADQVNTNGRVGWDVIYHWENAAWKPVTQLPQAWMFTDIWPWDKGRLLGLAVKTLPTGGPSAGYDFRVLDGPHGGPMPKLSAPTKAGCRTEYDVKAEIWPDAFLAIPSGHVFIAGNDCSEGTSVEWFAPGAEQGSRASLAPGCWPSVTFAGDKPESVFLMVACRETKKHEAQNKLFRFDGTGFGEVPYPGGRPALMRVTPAGALLVADASVLRKRAPDGAWSEIPLPAGVTALSSLHVASEDDLWATAGNQILRTRAPAGDPQRVEWPSYGVQMARDSLALPRAATKSCESIFALLFSFTRVTPDDYDFPLTRKALAGHKDLAGIRLVVTRDRGRKYFGAFAPSLEIGKKLVEVVQKGVPDSTPQLLCVKPEVVREMEIDLATGDVKKPAKP
jgi:hypothetical protein